MYDAFSVGGTKLEPERACPCALVLKRSKHFFLLRTWWTLCFYLIEVSRNLAQAKKACSVVRALVVKSQSILLRTWTLRPDNNTVKPVHHQNTTKRGSSCANSNCQQWGVLFCIDLITFKFTAKITHNPRIPTLGDFHPDRSGGQVVPRRRSPNVVDCEFGWKSSHVMVSMSSRENHPTLWLVWVQMKITHIMVGVGSGENHPTLWLVWVWAENHPTLRLKCVFGFPVNVMTLYKLTKLHEFIVFIFQFGGA